MIRDLHASGSGDVDDKIKMRSGVAPGDVRLLRSKNRQSLIVQLLDDDGNVSDSLTVENYYSDPAAKIESIVFADSPAVWKLADLAAAETLGTSRADDLTGRKYVNDTLYGFGNNDVYRLIAGAGHDVIKEYVGNDDDGDEDKIRVGSGIGADDVRLLRSGDGSDLIVQLLDDDGAVTDSLTVENHFTDAAAKVESIEFADKTLWDADDITAAAAITGGAGDDELYGETGVNNVFDSAGGGDDILYGRSGDDVYWLGAGGGHDVIREHTDNSGDAGDRIQIGSGIAPGDVRLRRSDNGEDLIVQLLDADGAVSDSLTVENHFTDASAKVESVAFADDPVTVWGASVLAAAAITGGAGDDELYGAGGVNDIFDSAAGGDDILHGGSGDDVYWLGAGAGHDVIREHAGNSDAGDDGDKIKIRSGYAPADVRLRRSWDGEDLIVQLLDADGAVSDSLTVESHYSDAAAKVESIVFADGAATTWGSAEMALAEIAGGEGSDVLYGESNFSDVFDADAGGNDTLYGKSGNDVYWLGAGTDHDSIHEYFDNLSDSGDAGDKIKIKSGFAPADVRLLRSEDGNDLVVQLLDDEGRVTDSLTVVKYYALAAAKVESVEFADSGTVWDANALKAAGEKRGTSGHDRLEGRQNSNDTLYGGGDNDVYLLGAGTGHDLIREYKDNSGDDADTIEVKSGFWTHNIRLRRSHDGKDLHVLLQDNYGAVTDSLTVEYHFADAAAKVETIEFTHISTVWTADDIAAAAVITGGAGNDSLFGESGLNNIFDSAAGGNDDLHGKSGDDVYWLGAGTDHDAIHEYSGGGGGDLHDEIKIKSGYGADDVRLWRSDDGKDLIIQLLNGGAVTDSLTVKRHFTDASAKVESVEFADGTVWNMEDRAPAAITGGKGDDRLYGDKSVDVFDSAAGGSDTLYGYGGNDVYWLGAGTDHDVIREYSGGSSDADDRIKIKSGYTPDNARLSRSWSYNGSPAGVSGNAQGHLLVELLDDSGAVTDSLTVENHFRNAAYLNPSSGMIERVEFADSATVWNAKDFALAEIRGGAGDDHLHGLIGFDDIFDSDAGGNDYLYGYSGKDVYWLGAGTDHDVINENFGGLGGGGADDRIKVKSGIALTAARLSRSGADLLVELLDDDGAATDSLKVLGHFTDAAARIESIEADGHVLRENQFQGLIDEIAAFTAGTSSFDSLADVYDHYWEEDSALAPSNS